MSDLLLCNEGLTSVMSLGCGTQPNTVGINEASTTLALFAPLGANGFQLKVLDS